MTVEYLPLYLWAMAALTTPAILLYVWRVWTKEQRLPLSCHYDDLQVRFERKEREVQELHQQETHTLAAIAEKRTAEIELVALRENLQRQKDELLKIEAERSLQERGRRELDQLQREIGEQSDMIKANQQLLREYEDKKEQLQWLQDKIAGATALFNEKESKLQNLKREIDKLHEAVEDAEAKCKTAMGEVDRQERALSDRQEEYRRLIEREVALKITLEQRSEALQTLKAEIARKKEELSLLQRPFGGDEASSLRQLTAPYLSTHFKTGSENFTEQQALQQLQTYLRNQGLHYDKRILYSFHTSLKVTKECPLVVMSGISGTGKSLLATFYAKAMGIHFLSMPVQPRWDTPQDLFGYYDFTKKQFQATELSRSLLQMDRFNREVWDTIEIKPEWIDDNLLVVLIDEMNIARVEHYFCELLSKLEMRRDCDENSRADRKRAEVTLDGCHLSSSDQNIRLFVDYNILIIGTTNEDESTLSLSDKILDRSNVIHFGKPTAFSSKKKNLEGCATPREMLSYEVWKKWIKNVGELPQKELQEIEHKLQEINHAMESMGKAFGHRTHQAIMAYMANYPREGSGLWHVPFADQLSQKLLGRLRGVDTAHHRDSLNAMEEIITSINQEDLSQKFKRAKESPYFEWK